MSPTDILKHEHEVVLLVLDGAEQMAKNIREKGEVDFDNIDKLVDFSRNFTDGCHHQKEEHLLFPKMEEKGFSSEAGPVAVMLSEHVQGRNYIAEIEKSNAAVRQGDVNEKIKLANAIYGYCELLKSHIMKENNILFMMADQALTNEDKTLLLEQFDEVEEETGEGVHEKYHHFAHELAHKYNVEHGH